MRFSSEPTPHGRLQTRKLLFCMPCAWLKTYHRINRIMRSTSRFLKLRILRNLIITKFEFISKLSCRKRLIWIKNSKWQIRSRSWKYYPFKIFFHKLKKILHTYFLKPLKCQGNSERWIWNLPISALEDFYYPLHIFWPDPTFLFTTHSINFYTNSTKTCHD